VDHETNEVGAGTVYPAAVHQRRGV